MARKTDALSSTNEAAPSTSTWRASLSGHQGYSKHYASAAGSIFDELWAYYHERLLRLFNELVPPPDAKGCQPEFPFRGLPRRRPPPTVTDQVTSGLDPTAMISGCTTTRGSSVAWNASAISCV